MNQLHRRRHDMMARVRDFGATYGHLFPESSLAAQAFAVVGTALADVDARDVAETMASVAARATRKQQARRALEERLQLVTRTAAVMPNTDAEFRRHFTVPAGGSDRTLLTTARQIATRAGAAAADFVAYGMPSTFLTELGGLIDRFEAALRDRGMSRDQLVAARAGIREAQANALKAVAQLDVMVANHLASNPVVTEVWRNSRRVARAPRPRRTPESAPVVTPPAGGSPPAPEPQDGGGPAPVAAPAAAHSPAHEPGHAATGSGSPAAAAIATPAAAA